MIDKNQNAPGWRRYDSDRGGSLDDGFCRGFDHVTERANMWEVAEREAQPFVVDVIERIAAWQENNLQEWAASQHAHELTYPDWLAEELRKMACGERPVP